MEEDNGDIGIDVQPESYPVEPAWDAEIQLDSHFWACPDHQHKWVEIGLKAVGEVDAGEFIILIECESCNAQSRLAEPGENSLHDMIEAELNQ